MDSPGGHGRGTVSAAAAALRGSLFVLAVAALVVWIDRGDLPRLLRVAREAPAGLGLAALVHAPQIVLTGWAWAILIPRPGRPGPLVMTTLRWFREGATALLPAGGLVGQTLAARALIHRGLSADVAAATATVDLTIEAVTQLLFTLGGVVLLLVLQGATDLGLAVAASLAAGTVALGTLVGLQRRLPLRWLGARLRHLPRRWSGGWTGRLVQQAARVQQDLRRLHAAPLRLLVAGGLHLFAWSLGALEIGGVLRLLGQHLGLLDALVVESIAQALRTAGFLLPGGIGIQEGAIIGACALVGVPPAPALIVALVRRAREVLFGVTGLALYRRVDHALAPR